MNKEDWNLYEETGKVPMYFFKSMVEAIKNGKTLNTQHLAVYQTHGQIIEMMLTKK